MHNYISMGERLFNGQIERSNRASTVTHELGHYLGLPDLYDTMGIEGGAWQGFNVDGLSVMASGSWGTDIPETAENLAEVTAIPVRLDPLCSYLLGFSTPVDITETGTYDIQASKTENGYEFYVMQVPGTDEYFLVENRIPQGFDRGLCGLYGTDTTGGIVVWHYDASAWEEYTATNTVNTTDHRPALMPAYIEERFESGGAFSRLLLDEYGYSMSKFLIDGVPTKVGFVCVTTPEALTESSLSNFQDKNGNTMVSFCEDETGQALYDRVQANTDWLRSDSMGCEYVVAVGHLGNQGVTPRWSSKEVIANTTGIDVFIDGHSHEQVNTQTPDKNGKDVLLVQTGAKLSSVGKLTLDSDGFDVEFITAESYAKKDADVTRALEGYQEEYQEELPETPDEETGDDTDQGSSDAEHEGGDTEPNTPSEDNASGNASLAETGDNPALLLACIAVACAAGIALIAAARRIASPSE